MTNAKEELLGILERVGGLIKCASIKRDMGYWDDHNTYVSPPPILLREGHSIGEYEEFLHKLDFKYDSGYGGQELFGTVWIKRDNTWLSRGEYDGSEWWEYNECPVIPNELKAN